MHPYDREGVRTKRSPTGSLTAVSRAVMELNMDLTPSILDKQPVNVGNVGSNHSFPNYLVALWIIVNKVHVGIAPGIVTI